MLPQKSREKVIEFMRWNGAPLGKDRDRAGDTGWRIAAEMDELRDLYRPAHLMSYLHGH